MMVCYGDTLNLAKHFIHTYPFYDVGTLKQKDDNPSGKLFSRDQTQRTPISKCDIKSSMYGLCVLGYVNPQHLALPTNRLWAYVVAGIRLL